jgi:hypothetical protein
MSPSSRAWVYARLFYFYMRFAVFCALAAALCGCGEKNAPGGGTATTNGAASNGSVLTAPVDYLRSVADGKQKAQATVDTTSIDKAAELFSIDKGRYPNSLDELVKEKYLPTMPAAPYGSKLQYDAKSGKVSVVKE